MIRRAMPPPHAWYFLQLCGVGAVQVDKDSSPVSPGGIAKHSAIITNITEVVQLERPSRLCVFRSDVDIGQECLILFFCHSIYFPEIFCLMELPSFTTVVEYVPGVHPGSPSRQKVTESAVLGLKRTRETVVGCFGEEELSLLSHCSFSYGCDERFVLLRWQWPAAGLLRRRGGGVLFGIYKYTRRERRE